MPEIEVQSLPQRVGRSVAMERQQRKVSRTNRTPISKGLLVNLGENIQYAIDAVAVDGGGIVTLVAGTHKVDYNITIPSFITLQGEGRGATIIDFQSQPFNVVIEGQVGNGVANDPLHARSVRVRDLTMQHSTHPAVLDVSYADFFVLDNVRFSANASTGLWMHACQQYLVINCLADNNSNFGFLLSGEDDYVHSAFRFVNCIATNNAWAGFAVFTAANGIVANGGFVGCESGNNDEDGFVFTGTFEVAIKLSGCISNTNGDSGFWADASYISFDGCQADDNGDRGFLITGVACSVNDSNATSNAGKDYDFTQRVAFTGNTFSFGSTTIPSSLADFVDVAVSSSNNVGGNTTTEKGYSQMKNTSSGSLAAGATVVLKAVAAGDEVTTTTTYGDDLVYGMVQFAMSDTAYGAILTEGYTEILKVDGTTDIAVGDFLSAFSTAGIAAKARAGDMAFAIALEAYTGNDSNGVINALLIKPRKVGAYAAAPSVPTIATLATVASQSATGETLGASYDDITNFEVTASFSSGQEIVIMISCQYLHTVLSSTAGAHLKLRDATASTDLRTFDIGSAVSENSHFASFFRYTIPSGGSRKFVVQGINDDTNNTFTIKNVSIFVLGLTATLS